MPMIIELQLSESEDPEQMFSYSNTFTGKETSKGNSERKFDRRIPL